MKHTTLQLLQAYPAGVELEYQSEEKQGDAVVSKRQDRAVLIGYTYDPLEKPTRLSTQVGISFLANRAKWIWVSIESVSLVLRPFELLCTPLSDGSIPAIEVSKLLVNDWAGEYQYQLTSEASDWPVLLISRTEHQYADEREKPVYRLAILKDWTFLMQWADSMQITHCENAFHAYDYLRAQHFAVGLAEDEYIRANAPSGLPNDRPNVTDL